jgi:hypothetical protein
MLTSAMRKKIDSYTRVASDKKIKLLYAILRREIEELEGIYSVRFIVNINQLSDYFIPAGSNEK